MGRPCVKRFDLFYWTVFCPVSLSVLSVTFVCYGQTVAQIKMKLGMQVGLGSGRIVLDGDPAPPKTRTDPQFSAHVRCSQTAGWTKVSLSMEVGLGPGVVLRWGPTSPHLIRKGHSLPNFRPMSIVTKRLDESTCHLIRR